MKQTPSHVRKMVTQATPETGCATKLAREPRRSKADQLEIAETRAKRSLRLAEHCGQMRNKMESDHMKRHFDQRAKMHLRNFDRLTLWIYRAEDHAPIYLPSK